MRYVILHQETGVCSLTLSINHLGFHNSLSRKYLKPDYFKDSFIEYKGKSIDWWGDWNNFLEIGERVISKIKNNKDYSKTLIKESKQIGTKLFLACRKVLDKNLTKLDNKKLAEHFEKLYKLAMELCGVGLAAVVSDLRHYKLSKLLKNIIREKIKKFGLKRKTNDFLSILITSNKPTYRTEERIKILKLADSISEKKEKSPQISRKIAKHHNKYCWLEFGHLGPEHNLEHYFSEIFNLIKNNPKKELKQMDRETKDLGNKQEQYAKELRLNALERRLFNAARDFMYAKAYRQELLFLTYYTLHKILKEISNRYDYKVKQLEFATMEEITSILFNKKKINKNILNKRSQHCIVFAHGDKVKKVIADPEAASFISKYCEIEDIIGSITTVEGITAYLGFASGIVKIVDSIKDIDKVKEGDILISVQTTPKLLPAMRKAAGFVTDIGGITSHAAIVAREMGKPCIIGTKIATRVFKDNDLVEVDADKGIVRKIDKNK